MTWHGSGAFLRSFAGHLAAVVILVLCVSKPLFLTPSLAIGFALLVVVATGALHHRRSQLRHLPAFFAGGLCMMLLMLLGLLLIDWAVGSGDRPLTLQELAAHLRLVEPSLESCGAFLLPIIATAVAGSLGLYFAWVIGALRRWKAS